MTKPHKDKCCDPKKYGIALHSNNAKLPGNRGSCAGSNRFLNPSRAADYLKSKKPTPEQTVKDAGFPIDANYKNPEGTGAYQTAIPFVDGCGNLLGFLDASEVRINWGQIKRMPSYDMGRLERGDKGWWKVDPARPGVEWVLTFATGAKFLWRVDADGSHLSSDHNDAIYDIRRRPLNVNPPTKDSYIKSSTSGWIPRAAVANSSGNHPIAKLFDCAIDCMSKLKATRVRTGKTVPYSFVDLPKVKWTKGEFAKGTSLSNLADAALQKRFGPDWIKDITPKKAATDPEPEYGQKPSKLTTADPKLTEADAIIRASAEKSLRIEKKLPKGPDKATAKLLDHIFHSACISASKTAADTNDAVGDYLARNIGLPSELRTTNLLWACPGVGGVTMDTFPLHTTFHRIASEKPVHTYIYNLIGNKTYKTKQKISWFYGYIQYPMGGKKTGKAFGWMLRNAVTRVAAGA